MDEYSESKNNYKLQLFLFPFAGGGKTAFNRLIANLDKQIEAVTIEYSGRGERINDGYITDYQEFMNDVVAQVNNYRNQNLPYAVLGYSMGTAIAYELAANDYGWETPIHAFFCARACLRDENLERIPDEEIIKYTVKLGGIDEKVLDNENLKNMIIHPLKEDYQIYFSYKYSKGNKPLTCPITVFYCEKDTPFSTVKNWSEMTSNNTKFYEFGNNHFFILGHYREMADLINSELTENLMQ